MLVSSGTGMALEKGVGKYRGFALLAIPMTGMSSLPIHGLAMPLIPSLCSAPESHQEQSLTTQD